MLGARQLRNDSTFLKLQRLLGIVRSLGIGTNDPALAREASMLATSLGSRAVPGLSRVLAAGGPRAHAAAALLFEIGSDPALLPRVLEALDALVPADESSRVALGALRRNLSESQSGEGGDTPDAINDLVNLLVDEPDYARLASELCEVTDERECVRFVADVAETAPDAGRHLACELLARDELSGRTRQELRRIASTVPPVCPVRYGSRRTAVKLGRSSCGKRVLVVTRKRSDRRWRVLFIVIDPSGIVTAAEYSDEATRHTIDKNIIGAATSAGFVFERVSTRAGRERLVSAVRCTRRAGLEIPGAYFVGRDLLSITDEHRREQIAGAEEAALLASALDALSSGKCAEALHLFERYTQSAPHDPEGFEGLGLCHMRLGNMPAARVALGRAAFLSPDEPRYHWNRAAAARSAGLRGACYLALRDYLRVARGRDRADRIRSAETLVADFERKAALYYPDMSVRSAACQADMARVKP